MILKNLEPYVRNYLQSTWSDYWNVTYNEAEDRIECIWNGIESTEIDFIYDAESEEMCFLSKEPQPVGDLVEMLTFLNEKVHEIMEDLEKEQER